VRPVGVDKIGMVCARGGKSGPCIGACRGVVSSHRIHVDAILLAEIVVDPETPLVSIFGRHICVIDRSNRIQGGRDARWRRVEFRAAGAGAAEGCAFMPATVVAPLALA
jgi:hypothetical protein